MRPSSDFLRGSPHGCYVKITEGNMPPFAKSDQTRVNDTLNMIQNAPDLNGIVRARTGLSVEQSLGIKSLYFNAGRLGAGAASAPESVPAALTITIR